ncbi:MULTISPECIES: hypothetical protein [unclassified Clostridioides]|uniref:hypothetical protein n=1 Tax=unclassified Clostridioides TaxID=2635829 RepID=UPI001D0C8270|nr:hypothetical protein [Clostridioides sp. ES-S-0001-03]MCC0696275.1 hypothetical protein [Clostridioides sp. ES-S-0048-02]
MEFIGIENITPYENIYEFSVYKYDDEITLGSEDLYICELRVILIKVNSLYVERLNKSVEAMVLVKNLKKDLGKELIVDKIKKFVLDEIWVENLVKENIEVIFVES